MNRILHLSALALALFATESMAVSIPAGTMGYSAKRVIDKQDKKQEAAARLQVQMTRMQELKEHASSVTDKIGKLATGGSLPTDSEGIALLKQLVEELQVTNEQLAKIQEQIDDINGWIEGMNEAIPIMAYDIATLKKPGISNYVQFQFVDTQESPGRTRNDGFQMRRFRMGQTNKLDDKLSMKLSFDVSSGSNRLQAELKDAQLIYDIVPTVEHVGTQLIVGQQPLPLGYELERSSTEREFPERTLYNNTMFAGERDRGVYLKHGFGPGVFGQFGVWNGLTVSDPQLRNANTFRNLNGLFAGTLGIRKYAIQYEFGVSGFFGKRPPVAASGNDPASPEVNRHFIFVDGTYVGLLTEALTMRAEAMFGRDRDPSKAGSTAKNMIGYQIQALYNLNYRNQVCIRYQYFDIDRSKSGNARKGIGFAYIYWLSPGAKLTFSYEIFDEEGPEEKNNVATVRLQFRL